MDDTKELETETANKSAQVDSVARRAELDTTQVINGIVPGTILADRYEIIESLGQGGMGSVYKARHNLIGSFLAVKVLHPHLLKDAASLDRFKAEAKASITMRHERLIAVSDYGISPSGQPFIVMEFVDGNSLSDLLHEKKRFTEDEFFDLFYQVCDGLSYVHQKGVVHRDIKPGNIMLSRTDDGKYNVHIVDFGIAKVLPRGQGAVQQLTQTGEIFGSPLYMSPEQCKGRVVDERADIYSLGCVMFEALTGVPPHRGESAIETLMFHVNDEAPKVSERHPEIPAGADIEQIVAKMLMTDPDARYQNMNQVKADLASRTFTGQNISGSATKTLGLNAAESGSKAGRNSAGNASNGGKRGIFRPKSSSSQSDGSAAPNTVPQLRSKVLRDTFVNPMIIAAAAVCTVWLVSSLNIKQPPVAISSGINDEKLREADLEFQLAQEKAAQGFTREAAEYSQKALDLRTQLVPNSLTQAESLNQRADIALHDAEHESMLLKQRRSASVERDNSLSSPKIDDTVDDAALAKRREARAARITNDYQLAERLLKQAIALADAKTPETDRAGAPVLYRSNITNVYLDQKKFKYAEETLKDISNLFLGQETSPKSDPDTVAKAFHDLFDDQYERLYWGTGRYLEAAKLRLAHHRPDTADNAVTSSPDLPFSGIWSVGRFSMDLHQTGNRVSGQTPATISESEKPGEEPNAVVGDISQNVARLTIGNSADVRISAVAVWLDNFLVFHITDASPNANFESNYIPDNAVLSFMPPKTSLDGAQLLQTVPEANANRSADENNSSEKQIEQPAGSQSTTTPPQS